MKTCSPTNVPRPFGNIFLTVTETNLFSETTVCQPAFFCSNSAITTVDLSAKYVQS